MEEKKVKSGNVAIGICIFVMIILVGIIGFLEYKYKTDMDNKNLEISILKSTLHENTFKTITNNVNEESNIETIENLRGNENSNIKIMNNLTELSNEEIYKLYEYIPVFDTNKISENAYQNKKTTIGNLDTAFLLENTFRKIEIADEDKTFEEGNEWYTFKENVLQENVKKMYGKTLENKSFEIGYGAKCSYENGIYRYTYGGGSGESLENIRNIESAYQEGEELYIIDNYKALIEFEEDNVHLKFSIIDASSLVEVLDIDEEKLQNESDNEFIERIDKKYKSKIKYKHTFTRDENGSYYWVSTEPML